MTRRPSLLLAAVVFTQALAGSSAAQQVSATDPVRSSGEGCTWHLLTGDGGGVVCHVEREPRQLAAVRAGEIAGHLRPAPRVETPEAIPLSVTPEGMVP